MTLAIFVRSYRRTTDDAAKNRMRWAAFGAVASGVTTLALFWLPELLLGRPIVGSSWLGIVALFFPFGLAFGILRYHLFDIDVVINRTLVYGGLTLGILASYAIVAAGAQNAGRQRDTGSGSSCWRRARPRSSRCRCATCCSGP